MDVEQSRVRHRRLFKSARTAENERGKWVRGGVACCCMEEGKWERALGMAVSRAERRTWQAMASDHRAWCGSAIARTRESGGATRLIGGAWRQRGPVVSGGGMRERRSGQRSDGALIGGPGPHGAGPRFKFGFKPIQKYSNGSNEIQILPNFGWFKRYLHAL
jgi:hypothetical protein